MLQLLKNILLIILEDVLQYLKLTQKKLEQFKNGVKKELRKLHKDRFISIFSFAFFIIIVYYIQLGSGVI